MTGSPLSILIPAVGGQGGGVLAEWIVEAAALEGLAAQSTSIPGVAQRTGSTTYYVELHPGPPDESPVFSLYPIPGAVDVLLAPEFLEVGRAIEAGMPSPGRTTIVASTHRLYSIHEKMASGRAIYPADQLAAAARALSRRFLGFDGLAAAHEHRTEVNAVLLGALAGSGAVPVRPESFRTAIERKGVQVDANLRGFDAGLVLAREGALVCTPGVEPARPVRTPEAFAAAVGTFPEPVRQLVGEAVARLVDYQDERYAALYLERLSPFVGAGDSTLAAIIARHLALWMTYEDAIRVADLKTRAGRLARIRADVGDPDAEIVVTDYLRPDLDELYGILPDRLVAPFARWAERRWPHGRPTMAQHVRTTSVLGYLRLWLLAQCRGLRPRSHRARREHERIERWLAAVRRAAESSNELACEVARAAQLVKGYGDVRRRMTALLDHLLRTVLEASALEKVRGAGVPAAAQLAATYRRLVLRGPDGEARAPALAAEVLAHLERDDPDAALAALKTAS